MISNAIKYSSTNGNITLKVSKCCDSVTPCQLHPISKELLDEQRMDLGTEEDEKNITNSIMEIRVKDTGLGIRKEDLTKLFKDFGRVMNEKDLIMNKGGVGLGLNLSNKLV